jgi:hypothetical protein
LVHNFVLEKKHIEIVEIATPICDEFGPDLAFIAIADWEKVSQLKASKTFYNLLKDRETMLESPPSQAEDLWFVCGVPNEGMTYVLPSAGFSEVLEFQEFCGEGRADRIFENDGFDYVEMDVDPNAEANLLHNFGGMSGGGLWRISVARSGGENPSTTEHLLAGLIFYEGRSMNGVRFIRCHGWRSIYKNVINALVT